jgi:UDP-N-acetylenolpyruvoylglucosamine reductase
MNTILEKLTAELGINLKVNQSLAQYTTFKIGGPAEYFYLANSSNDLINAIKLGRALGICVTVIGGGTNILVSDSGISGLVIKNNAHDIALKGMKGRITNGQSVGNVFVEADSGVIFNQLVRFTIEEGLGGLEMHLGLPGTVGGALYMNSKWAKTDDYVGNVLFQATILTPSGELKTVDHNFFRFGYDYSILQESHDIIVNAVFSLKPKSQTELWESANSTIAYRRSSQPQGVFTAGCTFRNISKAVAFTKSTPDHATSAGFLVDHVGLKGFVIGDAQISSVHANFIVNRGKATASDVLQLIGKAKSEVKKQFGVDLKEEIVKLGDFK